MAHGGNEGAHFQNQLSTFSADINQYDGWIKISDYSYQPYNMVDGKAVKQGGPQSVSGGMGVIIEHLEKDFASEDAFFSFFSTESQEGTRGIPPMTEETWTGMSERDKAQYILDTRYGANGATTVTLEDGVTYTIEDVIADLAQQPLKGEIDPTKAGFYTEEYGGAGPDGILGTEDDVSFTDSLAGRKAGQALSTSLTGLQGEAGKVTGAMQGVYGGSGIGMRAGIAGQKAIKTEFGEAQDVYGLAADTADLDYRKGMYGLEEDVIGDWESSWKSFYSALPEAT